MKRDFWILIFGISALLIVSFLSSWLIIPTSMAAGGKSESVLILDAGHGGEDGGASTASGQKESIMNLAVVLKLDQILGFCGVDSVLTRDSDISLHSESCETIREKKVSDLKNRVSFINSYENALVISVHQNHFTDPKYSGSQVFYNTGDISRQWGDRTQEILRQVLNPENGRRAKLLPDSVYLFKHITCPSILVECGFLSNGEEAALLQTESYQRKTALALAGACLQQLNALQVFTGGD